MITTLDNLDIGTHLIWRSPIVKGKIRIGTIIRKNKYSIEIMWHGNSNDDLENPQSYPADHKPTWFKSTDVISEKEYLIETLKL
jgi:hypothetical protein